jgi:succinoglycan biosynthesis protein ExoM
VVVDNDPLAGARAVVEGTSPFGRPCAYAHDPRPGLSAVRNTALRLARKAGAQWIAFVDDDEWPEAGWLGSLLTTAVDCGADVVTGPVRPVYDPAVPMWVRRGRFHQRRRYSHGSTLHYARTSNVLVRASLLGDDAFDQRFGRTGGEDTHLFERLVAEGRRIVWDDHAEVAERIPAERATVRWLLLREFRRGSTLARARHDVRPTTSRAVRTATGGAVRIAGGVLGLLPLLLLQGRAGTVRALRLSTYGAGLLLGRSARAQLVEYDNGWRPC